MLLIKHLFRDINMRQIVYFIYPIMYGMTVLSFICNSWLFSAVISISFFFCMDVVLIQAKNRVLDISKFYAIPKPLNRLFFDYFLYRLKISFLFSFLPSFIIGITLYSSLAENFPLMARNKDLYFFLFITLSWLFYMLMSTPLLPVVFRSKPALEVYKAAGFLFYLGFLITQLVNMKIPVPLSAIIVIYPIILLSIISIGYYFLINLVRQEKIFP